MPRARQAARAPEPLERDIQAATLDHWRKLGRPLTLVAAIPNQFAHGQPGLTPGLADLLVMGPDVPGHVAFMELKRRRRGFASRAKPTATEEAQSQFAMLCARLGIACPTLVGRDEPIRYLEKWNLVRQQRYPEPAGWADRFERLEWPS